MVDINNLIVNAVKTDSVNIEWDSTLGGTSRIEYGPTTLYGNTTSPELFSYFHITTISGLLPGITYHYRIRSVDKDGMETISTDRTFTTRTVSEMETAIRTARLDGGLPKIYYVNPSGDNINNGLSTAAPWKTLTYAVSKVDVGDLIYVMDGAYSNEYAVLNRSGTDFAPITIKAYSGTPTFNNSLVRNGSRYLIYGQTVSWWNIEGLTGLNYDRCIVFRYSSHHINIYNMNFDSNTHAIFISDGCHHFITRNFIITRCGHNAWYCYSGTYDATDQTSPRTNHILAQNVLVSNSVPPYHSFFDIHSNNDFGGINQSYITLWNCSGKDGNSYDVPLVYIHPQIGTDKYISIVNATADNLQRYVIESWGSDHLYVDSITTTNTWGILLGGIIKNTIFRNIIINMRPASWPQTWGTNAVGIYFTGGGSGDVDGVILENILINIPTPTDTKIIYDIKFEPTFNSGRMKNIALKNIYTTNLLNNNTLRLMIDGPAINYILSSVARNIYINGVQVSNPVQLSSGYSSITYLDNPCPPPQFNYNIIQGA